MQLFYMPNIEAEPFLEKEEHTHATKVLRKQVGDLIDIMNGKGVLFHCKIIEIRSKKTMLTVLSKETFNQNNNLHIAIAPTKNNNRMEFFLEKATEIGIKEITPMLCERSERKIIKQERMEKILVSAAKQSKHFYFPKFNKMTPFTEVIKSLETQKFIAHCEQPIKHNLISYGTSKTEPTLIIIGPEGDFSSKEIELARNNQFKELSLGDSRLRTETAAIVACTHYNLLK